ncbi:MAG: dTDP-4-dehydrorhamnose reductase [Clostridia bacterium]|nr:dTDP-4-dehydrorhamnose reductase [Clostridia bacterium]
MKILVTGVKGQLGYDIVKELLKRGYTDVVGVDYEDFDITDEKAVRKYIENCKPDVIMHNAAWTAVDKAEDMEEECYKVNVLGTKHLVEMAQELKTKFVYISTDYVFNGQGSDFFETNSPKEPLSVYGKTKYLGELEAAKCKKHFIVRISWVFGINGKNFVKTMLNLAKTKNELNVVDDQIGSPTYTFDLAKLLCDMIESEKYGVYHATNENTCSWYEFAKKIFEIAGKDVKVNPVSSKDYITKAVRPKNSRLSKKSLDQAGFKRLPSWEDALNRYINDELENEMEER